MSSRLQQLTELHQSDNQDPFITYGIALEYGKQEQYPQAIDWLDKTLALDGQYIYAYFQKAKMLDELDQQADALAQLEQGKAVAKQVGDEHAHSELVALYEELAT